MREQLGTRLFPVALMALLAALAFWLDHATRPEQTGRAGNLRHDPDYIVDRFEVKRFGADGGLQHTLAAQKMVHYPDDDSTEVAAPRLTYHSVPETKVFADRAWVDKDGKHVRLDGNVNIVRTHQDGRPPTRIVTSVLYAVPDDETARTDAPVTFSEGQTLINGSGFEADNKKHFSVLFGPVQGIIYPKRTQSGTAAP